MSAVPISEGVATELVETEAESSKKPVEASTGTNLFAAMRAAAD